MYQPQTKQCGVCNRRAAVLPQVMLHGEVQDMCGVCHARYCKSPKRRRPDIPGQMLLPFMTSPSETANVSA